MNEFGDRLKYLLALFTFIFIVIFIKNLIIDERTENVSAKVVRSELPPLPTEPLNELPPIPEVTLREYKSTEKEEKVTIVRKRRGYYGGTSRAAKSYGQTMFERNNK